MHALAEDVQPYVIISIVPHLLKTSLKGAVKALGLQPKAIWVYVLCNIVINGLAIYYFVFSLKEDMRGIWKAEICLESSIVPTLSLMIGCTDWQKISDKAIETQNEIKKKLHSVDEEKIELV